MGADFPSTHVIGAYVVIHFLKITCCGLLLNSALSTHALTYHHHQLLRGEKQLHLAVQLDFFYLFIFFLSVCAWTELSYKGPLCSLCIIVVQRLWYSEIAMGLIYNLCFPPPFCLPAIHFIKKLSMFIRKKKKKLNFKRLQFICMNSWLSQPSLSAVRRVQWGEWSTVNHYCYSTDYTARPSICLPPSLTLPPPSQDARIILPPDICLYSSLGPPTPVLSLSDPQIPSHMPSLMEKCSWLLALPTCRKRHLPGEWKKEEKYAGGFGKKTVSSIVVRGRLRNSTGLSTAIHPLR